MIRRNFSLLSLIKIPIRPTLPFSRFLVGRKDLALYSSDVVGGWAGCATPPILVVLRGVRDLDSSPSVFPGPSCFPICIGRARFAPTHYSTTHLHFANVRISFSPGPTVRAARRCVPTSSRRFSQMTASLRHPASRRFLCVFPCLGWSAYQHIPLASPNRPAYLLPNLHLLSQKRLGACLLRALSVASPILRCALNMLGDFWEFPTKVYVNSERTRFPPTAPSYIF